ncbi:MAG: hypothetical protein COX77_04070, partial [Candidatus Komeilibacteria bacterium CG_4_10_14_0_2_um_filter_37_10]
MWCKIKLFLSKLLVVIIILTAIILPLRSQAMAVADFGAIGATITQTGKDVVSFIWEKAKGLYDITAQYITSQAVMKSVDLFAQRLATSTAKTIASSGSGLNSLFE